MLKYSFIDTNLNDPSKQCFCIDVNTSKSPFVYSDNIKSMNITEQSFLLKPKIEPSKLVQQTKLSNTSQPKPEQPKPELIYTANDKTYQDLQNNSLTTDNEPNIAPKIDLNKMANIYGKVYKKIKKDDNKKDDNKKYSLMENFNDCPSDCVVQKPLMMKNKFIFHRYLNENTYIFVIIILLLLLSYMTRKN